MRLLIAFLLLMTFSNVARADYQAAHVDLACDRVANLALVRFAMSENDSPPRYATLPTKIDDGSIPTGPDRTDCRLSRGWDIRIRAGEGQVFPYGAGGADPPAFFSLWINRRKVLSKFVWKSGYEAAFEDKPSLVGLFIRPESLTFCFQRPDDKAVTCRQQHLEMRKRPIDQEEYPEGSKAKTPVGTILIEPTSPDTHACQRYLDAIKIGAPEPSAGLPYESRLSRSMTFQPRQKPDNSLRNLAGAFANVQDRRVAAVTGGSHYFDGDIFVIAPHDASLDDVDAFFPSDGDLEQVINKPPRDGWTIISGGQPALYPKSSPRYIHLLPEEIDGELFFLAYPANHDVRPSAILVKPLRTAGFVSLCTFQRTEPHF